MSFRFMRVIVFFDLPMELEEEKKEYRTFRKYLLGNGFIMMQKSVYSKLVTNTTAANMVIINIKKECPKKGIIQIMLVTEKQYNNIELIIGENDSNVINSTDKLVIL